MDDLKLNIDEKKNEHYYINENEQQVAR